MSQGAMGFGQAGRKRVIATLRGVSPPIVIASVAFALQGCSSDCPGSSPITGLELDLEYLDTAAGCKNEWSLLTGNPCASDMPVLWAKKGAERAADEEFMKSQVEAEFYQCRLRSASGLFCAQWAATETSCREEDYGECMCLTESPNGAYCQKWQCIGKEAEQNVCWKSCCGDECTPCIECGHHSSSPFRMNPDVYNELLAMDGISPIAGEDAVLSAVRQAHYGEHIFRGECIANRDIHHVWDIGCHQWREIETELAYCVCREAPDERYCAQWTCEEKDVGQFSILFTKPMDYDPYIEGSEKEVYTCLETAKNQNGGTTCSHWRGDSASYEEAEVSQCKGCTGPAHCSEWRCDEYELPRIHDEDVWWKRALFFILHMAWMVPLLCFCDMGVFYEVAALQPPPCKWFVCFVALCCNVFLIYSICFLRWEADERRWRAPVDPMLGLALVLGTPFIGGAAISCMISEQLSPSFFFVPVFVVVGGMWTIGVIPPAVAVVVLATSALLGGWSPSFSKVTDETAESEELELYEYQEPNPIMQFGS